MFEKEIGIKCGAINTKNSDLIDERLKRLYRSLYLYIILNWTVVIPLHLYIKPSLEDVLQMENGEVPLEDTEDFFLHKAGLTVIPICAKKKQQQHLGHFPQKKPQKINKTCPALSTFLTERKKVTTQFKFRCYYKKKRYPF